MPSQSESARLDLRALRETFENLVTRAKELSASRGLSAEMRRQLDEFVGGVRNERYLLIPMVGHRAYIGQAKKRAA
jgi:hypothetical protein